MGRCRASGAPCPARLRAAAYGTFAGQVHPWGGWLADDGSFSIESVRYNRSSLGFEGNEEIMQEEELWRQYRETGSRQLKEELILRNAPLVRACANAFRRRMPSGIEYADLLSYGLVGLMDAVSRYDTSYNREFAIYARSRIHGAIIDGIRSEAGIPRSVYLKWKRISQAEEELTSMLQRKPGQEEIADFMGLDSRQYNKMLGEVQSWRLLSLDEMASGGDGDGGYNLLDVLVDQEAPDPGASIEDDQRNMEVRRAVQGLPKRHQIILDLHYYQDLNLKEIAEVLSISESRASQMHRQALARLKNSMNSQPALLSA
jgi:RNA polymerase sigma factor for flagellar operon FliA